MKDLNLIEFFADFKEAKNINREKLRDILEKVIRSLFVKKYGSDETIDVVINDERGDLEIWRNREIVKDKDLEDYNLQIAYSEAVKIESDFEIGEEVSEQLYLSQFSRRDVSHIKQNLKNSITDLEKLKQFELYEKRVGQVVRGEVYQIWKNEVLLRDDEGNELILPKQEQIPADFYRKGDSIKAIVKLVEMRRNNPYIMLSRTDPVFLHRLFEEEIPEVEDGLITIKKIVRIPGERAKVSVESYDERIDPVGACVGMKGTRIHGIVRELKNENIDVINYTDNFQLYVSRALNPAKINSINVDEENKKIDVYLDSDQVSLAIGKGGFNIKLAGYLTGYEIDVYRESDNIEDTNDDVLLSEFSDVIDSWVIEEFRKIGCDTAKSVLDITFEDLVKRTDLENETVEKVIEILKAEFE